MRVLAGLILLSGFALAEPGRVYLTAFGRRVLLRTDQVVAAEVVRIHPPFRGITTATLRVLERLQGLDRSRELVLMYVDELSAPDAFGSTLERSTVSYERRRRARLAGSADPHDEPSRPRRVRHSSANSQGRSVRAGRPGIRLAKGEAGLFFLARKGATYALTGLVPAADPLYAIKLARLRQLLQLESVAAIDLRARQAKRLFLQGMQSDNPWSRGQSAREIVTLATRFPAIFTKPETEQLAGLLLREREPPIQAALERALRTLDPKAALAFAARAEQKERRRFAQQLEQERRRLDQLKDPALKANDIVRAGQRYGRAATGLVALYLTDPEPIVRERAAHTLAERGGPSCRVALREALADERDDLVVAALLYACGMKSDREAVPLVAARLKTPALERDAIHALARIGSAGARKVLLSHRAKRSGEVAELIDSLLREEFSRQE